ncbi:hypothetical protein [Nocardiopsis dassonvillei]|uniref:hypothetical protein n=1 Tax=Nocardiopsis dassonvillei TaxID=2014 RepID=UPI00366F85CB
MRSEALERLLTWYLRTAYAALGAFDSNLRCPAPDELLRDGTHEGPVFTANGDAVRWFELEGKNLMTGAATAVANDLDGLVWRFPLVLRHFPAFHSLGAE